MDKLQKDYLDFIIEVANKPSFPNKIENINELLKKYYSYCFKNKIVTINKDLNDALKKLYITDIEPNLLDVDVDYVREIIDHLENIDKTRLEDGLSSDEVTTLLNWLIFVVRDNLSTININEINYIAPSILYYLGKELNLSTTFNDDTVFPNNYYPSHFFTTVTIPVKNDYGVADKTYLLDVNMKELFSLAKCHEGLLVEQKSLDPGYYLCKTLKGKAIAKELLKKGYVELNPEIAKIYGTSFSLSRPYQSTSNTCFLMTDKEYFEAIMEQKREPNMSKRALETLGYNFDLPVEYLL